MKKPIDMQLIDEFCQFLADNGYSFKYEATDYASDSKLTITFPRGMKITMKGMPAFDSTQRYVFDQEEFDEYNRNNDKSGNNLPPANAYEYWNRKPSFLIKVKDGLLWAITEGSETMISTLLADKIASANNHPESETPFGYAEHFVKVYEGKQLRLNEKYQIIGRK